MPVTSIVIRARNEAQYIGETLKAIRQQSDADAEVIVVDSGSVDGTGEIAYRAGAHVVYLDPALFTYGYALNLGISLARGEFIVSLSAHALPASPTWLAALRRSFADPMVAAVYGRHIPRPNVAPLELAGMYVTGITSRRSRREVRGMRYSNTNGAFRRAIWERFPFDENLPGAEDSAWAKQVHAAGYVIVYEPEAGVHHSHGESLQHLLRRQMKDQSVRLRLVLGHSPVPTPVRDRARRVKAPNVKWQD